MRDGLKPLDCSAHDLGKKVQREREREKRRETEEEGREKREEKREEAERREEREREIGKGLHTLETLSRTSHIVCGVGIVCVCSIHTCKTVLKCCVGGQVHLRILMHAPPLSPPPPPPSLSLSSTRSPASPSKHCAPTYARRMRRKMRRRERRWSVCCVRWLAAGVRAAHPPLPPPPPPPPLPPPCRCPTGRRGGAASRRT